MDKNLMDVIKTALDKAIELGRQAAADAPADLKAAALEKLNVQLAHLRQAVDLHEKTLVSFVLSQATGAGKHNGTGPAPSVPAAAQTTYSLSEISPEVWVYRLNYLDRSSMTDAMKKDSHPPYFCRPCMDCGLKSKLIRHALHKGIHYSCTICSRTFVEKTSLLHHRSS